MFGSIAFALCQLAGGRLDGMATLWRCRSVDVAAAQLIVRESGGLVAFTGYSMTRSARHSISSGARRSWPHARPPGSPSSRGCHHQSSDRLETCQADRRGPRGRGRNAESPPGDIAAIAADAEERVRAYTPPRLRSAPLPEPEMVSRAQWIDANLRSMRPVLDRVGARVGNGMGILGRPTRAITRGLLSAQIGGLTGFLAQRVLGQYDMPLLDSSGAARLLMVGPNLGLAAQRLEADSDELMHWVTLHEVTHAVQFGSVPWLRLHLAALVREVVDTLEVKVDTSKGLRLPGVGELRDLIDSVRKGELVTLVIGRERRILVDRIQATMAVIEGPRGTCHGRRWGRGDPVPGGAPRTALDRRRMGRSGPMRLLERVLGFELKLRQYRDGKRFCDHVVERVGIEGLNRLWSAPHALPTLAEIADPDSWIARTAVPYVTN